MKILAVQETDWFQRGPHQQHHIFERLAKRGHEVRVIHYPLRSRDNYRKGWSPYPLLTERVCRVTEGPGVAVLSPPFVPVPLLEIQSMAVTHALSIRTQLKTFKPDVVVGYSILNSHIAMTMANRRGIPFVYHILDVLYGLIPWPALRGLGKLIEDTNLREADIVLGINEALLDLAVERGADPTKCRVVGTGVDLNRFENASAPRVTRENVGIEDTEIVLGYMGWVYPFSGLIEVLPSIVQAREEGINVKLMVVGDGDAARSLLAASRSLGIQDQVILTGWQPYSLLPSYLGLCDIFLYPALKRDVVNHIVPMKFYECLAAGKPIVTTNLKGIAREFRACQAVHRVERSDNVVPAALELLGDHRAYGRDQIAAKTFVRLNCDWTKITRRFEDYLEYAISLRETT